MSNRRFEEIDFEPRKNLIIWSLILLILFYGLGFGGVTYFFALEILGERDLSSPTSLIKVGVILFVYGMVLFLLLFYMIFSPYRFLFKEEGVVALTWRGRQFFPWQSVKKATVTSGKGSINLALHLGGLLYLTIPLDSYKKGGSLLAEVSRRLPVAVAVSDTVLARLADE
jgi:hypothetical protein